MQAIRYGNSSATDPTEAIQQLHSQIWGQDVSIVVFFFTLNYDLKSIHNAISSHFADCLVIGCSAARTLGPDGYLHHGISGISFSKQYFIAQSCLIRNLKYFDITDGAKRAAESLLSLQIKTDSQRPQNFVGILLVDGLSLKEEPVAMAIQNGVGGIHVIGGSSGDDLSFKNTFIYNEGEFHEDAALLLLIHSKIPFVPLRIQHFVPDEERLVVTRVEEESRIVHEINGLPAVEEYARIVGVPAEDLAPEHFAAWPVVVMIDGSDFVRSIRSVNADGSLTFYCAIDEGIVLRVAHGEAIMNKLERAFKSVEDEIGNVQAILTFDCILRNLEIEKNGLEHEARSLFCRYHAVGFCTYGEQFDGVHVNQTMTGIAFGNQDS